MDKAAEDEGEDEKFERQLAVQFFSSLKSWVAGLRKIENRKAVQRGYRAILSETCSPAAAAAKLLHLEIDPDVGLDITTEDEEGNA